MLEARIRAEHVNPFIKATIETFESMMKSKAIPGKPGFRAGAGLSYDISGIIGLSGGAKGSVALSFPKAVAAGIAKAFTGMEDPPQEMVADVVGELANIIAGAAKRDLSQYRIGISLPTVVTGDNHGTKGPADAVNMVIPFESGQGKFDLAVSFKSLD